MKNNTEMSFGFGWTKQKEERATYLKAKTEKQYKEQG